MVQILKGLFIEMHYKFLNFGGSIWTSVRISQGPQWISGGFGGRDGEGTPEPWFNIKMSSYQYKKSHCGDKTVIRSSYLHNGISYTGKMSSLYWIRAQSPVIDTLATPELCLNVKMVFPGMKISVIKIRGLWECFIFIMGINIRVRQQLHIQMTPGVFLHNPKHGGFSYDFNYINLAWKSDIVCQLLF